jgi:Family of unknown function (DUF6152)
MIRLGHLGAAAVLAAILGTVSVPALAHHSFPATYQVDKMVTIQGTVVEFLFRNPHSFVHVLAPDENGKMVTWAVEWGAGATLQSAAINRSTLKPGDKVIVTGNPARDTASHRMRMRAIVRPADGWKWEGTFG